MHARGEMQMEGGSDNLELGFASLDFEDDQKPGLIDISLEDDDLLSDSPSFNSLPGFRLSVTLDGKEENLLKPQLSQKIDDTVEKLLQKEQEISPFLALVPESPCSSRKSLAWDNAFFTNEGVLDNDELTLINEGFKTAEMQPVTIKDVNTGRFKLSSASRKINASIQNRTNKSASARGSMNIQGSLKNKRQRVPKREESHSLSLKASKSPKVSSTMISLLTGKGTSASIDAYHAKKEIRAETMRSVDNLKLSKKSALEKSYRLSSPCPAEFVSSVFARFTKSSTASSSSHVTKESAASTEFPLTLLTRKTDSRKERNISITTSVSDAAMRYLEKGQEVGHPRCSTQALSLSNNFSCISPANSSVGSCSVQRSLAMKQFHKMEVYPDTSVTLRRATSSHNEVIASPYLMNNLHRKSPFSCPQKEEPCSPAELNYQCTPATHHVPAESRKKLKPSYLRVPSPKIGFFDEEKSVMPTMQGSLQLQFEAQCTSPSKNGPTNRETSKLARAGMTPETVPLKHGSRNTQRLHSVPEIKPVRVRSDGKLKSYSPKVWSTTKTRSDVDSKFQSGICGEVGEWICSKCRKIGSGILDRKVVGKISALRQDDEKRVKGRLRSRLSREVEEQKDDAIIPKQPTQPVKNEQHRGNNLQSGNEDERGMLAKFEDQVNDLSKYFEVIDLTEDMLIENDDEKEGHVDSTISSFAGENVGDNRKQEATRIFSNHSPTLSGTEFSPSSRTPLADKTAISNRSGSLKLSSKEKLKSLVPTFSDKENSFPYGS